MNYPTWDALLLPHFGKDEIGIEVPKLLKARHIDPMQAIQIAEDLPDVGRDKLLKYYESKFFIRNSLKFEEKRVAAAEKAKRSPFPSLLKMPLHRFVTTNYDEEIERALSRKLGPTYRIKEKSFEQDDVGKLGIFAVALASNNRNMVFHCHGTIRGEIQRIATAIPDTKVEEANGFNRRRL